MRAGGALLGGRTVLSGGTRCYGHCKHNYNSYYNLSWIRLIDLMLRATTIVFLFADPRLVFQRLKGCALMRESGLESLDPDLTAILLLACWSIWSTRLLRTVSRHVNIACNVPSSFFPALLCRSLKHIEAIAPKCAQQCKG